MDMGTLLSCEVSCSRLKHPIIVSNRPSCEQDLIAGMGTRRPGMPKCGNAEMLGCGDDREKGRGDGWMIPSGLDDWDEWDGDMKRDGEMIALAEAVKALFEEWYGELREEDFVAVADLLGFDAHKKAVPGERLKPVAKNYFPDIIGTNLEYAVEAYRWRRMCP